MKRSCWIAILLALLPHLCAAQKAVKFPGPRADGSVLLPNQWAIHPVGRQVELGGFPVNAAIHPQGRYAAVLDCGAGPNQVLIVDLKTGKITARGLLPNAFYGLAFSADGRALFCSGGADETVHWFDFANGQISNDTPIRVHDPNLRGVPCGLALDAMGRRIFVANVWGNCVSKVELNTKGRPADFNVGSAPARERMTPLIPPEEFKRVPADFRDETGFYFAFGNDAFPYGCCLDENRGRLYTSLWGQAAVSVIDLKRPAVPARWPAEAHPCEMVLSRSGGLLYVANAGRNTVTVFDTVAGRAAETMAVDFHPGDPPGAGPVSLALSPDERTLFVANANVNAVAVFSLDGPARSHSLGFIPSGGQPASVRVTPDGRQLLIANGKGGMRKPGDTGGSLSIIDLPPGPEFERKMVDWSAQVYENTPLMARAAVTTDPPRGCPIPSRPGDPCPIKYVIYIIKENLAYDQVLGDVMTGNGDPRLCVYPERLTPNHHKLARDFVLLDNFYADASSVTEGQEWCLGAGVSDFLEKMAPMNSGHGDSGKFPYPAEGCFTLASPPGGYLWDRAVEAGLTFRNYGEFVTTSQDAWHASEPRVRALQEHTDFGYRCIDPDYLDTRRALRFVSEFNHFESAGVMPRLQIVRLPNDRVPAAMSRSATFTAALSDNDFALGQIVEAVSHSKYWSQTAIFVVESSARGVDHIDSHRSLAYVISPYTRGRGTDSTMYSTCSVLRTIELILGLQPMTQFDAAATPMFAVFRKSPQTQGYAAAPAGQKKPVVLNAGSKIELAQDAAR